VHGFNRTQLWGAANPTNAPGVPFIFDADARVGMCGDWLLGSSVQSACLSGLAMAGRCMPCHKSKATGGSTALSRGGAARERHHGGTLLPTRVGDAGLQSTSTIKCNSPGRERRWTPPSA
jgi:hypothetical protein